MNQDAVTTWIIEERPNPSTDFFIAPRLKATVGAVVKCQLHAVPASAPNVPVRLIFVRYISKEWQRWVSLHQDKIAGIYFFMDDDLFALQAMKGLPWHYQLKLIRFAWSKQTWLQEQNAKLWVSTSYLATKYKAWQPDVLAATFPEQPGAQITLFYHGSASHRAEIEWLKPLIETVLHQHPHLCFELIGDAKVRRLFSHCPRVHVLHPMTWPAYQALLARGNRHIGLAPLLNTPFNSARSCTKFFDITAAGAVGIYAEHPVYNDIVESGKNGVLVEMKQDSWVTAINMLIENCHVRHALYEEARQTCQQKSPAQALRWDD